MANGDIFACRPGKVVDQKLADQVFFEALTAPLPYVGFDIFHGNPAMPSEIGALAPDKELVAPSPHRPGP